MHTDIFKEFDAILAALKPSQYRSLWQLYNYDKSKKEKYHEAYIKNNAYQFGLPGEQCNILTQNLYERALNRADDNHVLVRREAKTVMKRIRRYYDLTLALVLATEFCLGKNIDTNMCMEQFGFDKFVNDPARKELLNIQAAIADHDEILNGEHLKFMDYERALEYLPTELSERLTYLMRYYKDKVIAEFKKHIGETIPLADTNDPELHEKDGVYYWNDTIPPTSGMDGDTLVWYNASANYNPTAHIKANPLVRSVYNSLFPNGKNRIYLPTTANITKKDIYSSATTPMVPEIIEGICLLAKRYLKEKKHFDLVKYDRNQVNSERFFIDGLFDYERDGKTISIRIGKILDAYRNSTTTLSNDEMKAIKYYHLIKQPRHFSGYIIISRHPYDIAGMSTGRGWRSCMHLDDGQFNEYVPQTIAAGGLIAYLCNEDDKNIKNPKGRVLIKPFAPNYEDMNYKEPNFKLFCSRVYGVFYDSCLKELQDWLDDNWNIKIDPEHKQLEVRKFGYFNLPKHFYRDVEDDD